ncbi:MAG: type II toxin-antitoxin system RelE/ParE family toxin [Chloroflexi bacterium]|nr:MAG: type II toxin-antitoxin system RelE/ParE family toxin [Chloroflexota bacterium]
MYTVYVLPQALHEVKRLPGHVRQRVKRIIDSFAENPRPSGSVELSDIAIAKHSVILHRFKIEKWRIIYAIDEEASAVDVMAIRQRPPYDYGDLSELIQVIQ